MLKFIIITFFIAISISFFIFNLYSSKNIRKEIDALSIEENSILNRCGSSNKEFRLCSYPEPNTDSQIALDENIGYSNGRCLRIIFKGSNVRQYLGIHLTLTLNLSSYLANGSLEFWIKGNKESSSPRRNLDVYLKEGPIKQQLIGISVPIEFKEDWQKISLPLNKFLLIKEGVQGFSWLIQEFLFSISPLAHGELIELFIDDLKVIDNDKIIYEFLQGF